MFVLKIFAILFESLKNYISRVLQLAKYQSRYPNCRFYRGTVIINSKLGDFNVLFQHTQIISSTLGSHTYIQKYSTVNNANIGKFCSIASNVSIGPGIHKLDGVSTHPAFYLRNTPLIKKYSNKDEFSTAKETCIGHDVWIGEKAIVLDGVNIGTGAVVAAGAVVAKDVAPYTIVGGVPAKIIKTRFSGAEIDFILNSKWWEKNEEWLIENYKSFNNISDFIKLINGSIS